MKTKRLWIALTAAPALAAFVAVPNAGIAATKHRVKCEITRNGKTETKKVATARDCTDMGGKVVTAKASTTTHTTKKY
jgi:hypothetical protein